MFAESLREILSEKTDKAVIVVKKWDEKTKTLLEKTLDAYGLGVEYDEDGKPSEIVIKVVE